jgi:hypothetical protein
LSVEPAGAAEVEAMCLAGLALDDRPGYMAARSAVVEAPLDTWNTPGMSQLLRRLALAIDRDGGVQGEGFLPLGAASVDLSWVLYLRRRRPDYQGFLDELRLLYKNGGIPPPTLQAVVVDAPSSLIGPGATPTDDERLLLPLPTNEEQTRILRLAQRRPGVTVQGPPGTGKSHTIANLVSHYVAHGRRVLVTAEKEQALRALDERIPPGIRELAVSVLGADADSRARLESSIKQIQTRVTGLDRTTADREIARLTRELDRLDREIAATTDSLFRARSAEVETLIGSWAAGPALTPSAAARWVAANATPLGYIPDTVSPTMACPLSASELGELVSLIRTVGISRARECSRTLPTLEQLPTAEDLGAQLRRLEGLRNSLAGASPELTDWSRVDSTRPEDLRELASDLEAALAWWSRCAGSWLDRVSEQVADRALAAEWAALASRTRSDREDVLARRRELAAHDIGIPDNPDPGFVLTLEGAHRRLSGKGKLGIFAREARRALAVCMIDGRPPATAEEIHLCLRAIQLSVLRRQLRTRWSKMVATVGGPALEDPNPEDALGRHLDDLDAVLDGRPSRGPLLAQRLAAIGAGHGRRR